MERNIERFLLENSTPEDPILEDLFRQTHLRFINPNMACGHLQGKLLQFISSMLRPETILEIGTYTGYSAICLSRGLNPGGKLYTIEINDELFDFASGYFKSSGEVDKIVRFTGNAIDIIPSLDLTFDLVYIDGDKREYCDYYRLVIEKVRPGGFILADNVLWGGQALDEGTGDMQANGIIRFNEMLKTESGIERLMLPFRDGITLIMKKQ